MKKTASGITLAKAIEALERIAPLELAEEWDNVGCLIAPTRPRRIRRVLLTIDTSPEVVDEAIRKQVDLIVSYHPPLFQPTNRLHPDDVLQNRLLKLIESRIAVYSPHTALDAVDGGVNDWLADGVSGKEDASRSVIDDGPGRLIEFQKGLSPNEIIQRISSHLSVPYLRVARPAGRTGQIRRVALCAGAGFSALASTQADLYLTGEMKHHDVLGAVAQGSWVVLSEHTHTERGYLPVLRRSLTRELKQSGLKIVLSARDRDPLELIQ